MLVNNRLVITIPHERKNPFYDFDLPDIHPKGTNRGSIKVRLAAFTRRESLQFPTKPLSQNKFELAEGIDRIWKNNDLFAMSDQPESFFYKDYADELIKILRLNIGLFGPFGRDPNFIYEFETFKNRKDISELEKAIFLTQAFELALFGSNPTKVLSNINSKGKNESKGHKNELLAAWFLAKFIYELSIDDENPFLLSLNLRSYERDKERSKTFSSIKEREIDILTKDSIVSVKSMDDSYSKQIRNLFFLIADGINPGLKERVEKIILIKSVDSSEKRREIKRSSPDFRATREYAKLIESETYSAKDKIEKYGLPPNCKKNEYERFIRRFLTPENIEIYYMPNIAKDFGPNLKDWINENYEYLEMKKVA